MSKDNRKAPRIPLDVEVNYSSSGIAHTRDISEGGIGLITENELEAGSYLNLVFTLPYRNHKVEAIGKVIHCRKASEHYYQSGLTFWQIEDTDLDILKLFFADQI